MADHDEIVSAIRAVLEELGIARTLEDINQSLKTLIYHTTPTQDEDAALTVETGDDMNLPGMWSHSDFTGGETTPRFAPIRPEVWRSDFQFHWKAPVLHCGVLSDHDPHIWQRISQHKRSNVECPGMSVNHGDSTQVHEWSVGDACEMLRWGTGWIPAKVVATTAENFITVETAEGPFSIHSTRVAVDLRPVESSVTQSTPASAEGDLPERKAARKLLPQTLRGLIETHRENEPADKSSDEWIDWRRNLSDLTGESEWD